MTERRRPQRELLRALLLALLGAAACQPQSQPPPERASERIVLVVYSGRPLAIADLQADAVVAAWLPGSEAAALADLITGRAPFHARTPQPWPRSNQELEELDAEPLYQVGHGLGT